MNPKLATGRVGIYARYSTDKQKEASIEDQVREARTRVARAGGDPARRRCSPMLRSRPEAQPAAMGSTR